MPLPILAAFSLPGIPLAGMALILVVFMPRFYVGLGNSFPAVAGAIVAVRLLDVWLDPFLGLAMDRTLTPIGRYRPWLIAGAPIAMIGLYKLLIPGGGVGTGYLIVWMLVTYAGASMLNLAVAAWSAVLAPTYHERSRVLGITQGLAVVGAAGLLLLPLITHGQVILGKAASMPAVAAIMMTAIPLAVLICCALTPERLTAAPRGARFSAKDLRYAVTRPSLLRIVLADLVLTLGPGTTGPLYVYFFHDAKGFGLAEVGYLLIFYIAAGLAGSPTWGALARRLGKHRTIQIACVCYGVTQTILMALPRVWPGHHLIDTVPTLLGMMGVGFCASAFLLLIRAMVADVVDEVRLENGRDLTSLMYSMVTTTTKIGQVISLTVVFPILALVGYNGKEGATNTPGAIFGLEMCYLFAPIILVFVGGAMFFGYRLDARRHGVIRAALDARDAAHTAAAEPEAPPMGAAQRA
jgi:Na+/melibiose symporter-like transporter